MRRPFWLKNWRTVRFRARIAAYGLTHRRCVQCGRLKGLTTYRNCERCQIDNIFKLLEVTDDAA